MELSYITSLLSRQIDISRAGDLSMTISNFAGATISIKKFFPRHRRQTTSPFIAEGDPSFLRIRSCGALPLTEEVHANDPAARDSSSLPKLPVIPDAELFHHLSLISHHARVIRSLFFSSCFFSKDNFLHRHQLTAFPSLRTYTHVCFACLKYIRVSEQ